MGLSADADWCYVLTASHDSAVPERNVWRPSGVSSRMPPSAAMPWQTPVTLRLVQQSARFARAAHKANRRGWQVLWGLRAVARTPFPGNAEGRSALPSDRARVPRGRGAWRSYFAVPAAHRPTCCSRLARCRSHMPSVGQHFDEDSGQLAVAGPGVLMGTNRRIGRRTDFQIRPVFGDGFGNPSYGVTWSTLIPACRW